MSFHLPLSLSVTLSQRKAPKTFGVLRFSHIYENDKALKITVVSAEDLPGLDKSGKTGLTRQLGTAA